MERLKAVLLLDWRRRNDARAKVRVAIEDALDSGLPRAYTPEVYQQKCTTVFEHVFESYGGTGGKWAGEAA
jgi:type I restriction enzyme R subunit